MQGYHSGWDAPDQAPRGAGPDGGYDAWPPHAQHAPHAPHAPHIQHEQHQPDVPLHAWSGGDGLYGGDSGAWDSGAWGASGTAFALHGKSARDLPGPRRAPVQGGSAHDPEHHSVIWRKAADAGLAVAGITDPTLRALTKGAVGSVAGTRMHTMSLAILRSLPARDRLLHLFSISWAYVIAKLALLLFPFRRTQWRRRMLFEQLGLKYYFVPPRLDVLAPDLYVPLLGLLGTVLLAARLNAHTGAEFFAHFEHVCWRAGLLVVVEASVLYCLLAQLGAQAPGCASADALQFSLLAMLPQHAQAALLHSEELNPRISIVASGSMNALQDSASRDGAAPHDPAGTPEHQHWLCVLRAAPLDPPTLLEIIAHCTYKLVGVALAATISACVGSILLYIILTLFWAYASGYCSAQILRATAFGDTQEGKSGLSPRTRVFLLTFPAVQALLALFYGPNPAVIGTRGLLTLL